jgi:trehalose 6-phosphate synthase/phosphatase
MATLKLDGDGRRKLLKAEGAAKNRLFILDYDGTLVEFSDDPEDCEPGKELTELLTELAADKKNTVVVISGRKSETLNNWLGKIENLILVAEHGIWERDKDGKWNSADVGQGQKWMDMVGDVMNFYVDRTPGSFLEIKSNSMAWHYRKAEKGLGEVRKSELTSHLKHMMNEQGFHVLDGDHVVEIKPDGINKGHQALKWFNQVKPDLAVCLGDDTTDEDMFRSLPEEAYTIKIGPGNSYARYALETVKDARRLLAELA